MDIQSSGHRCPQNDPLVCRNLLFCHPICTICLDNLKLPKPPRVLYDMSPQGIRMLYLLHCFQFSGATFSYPKTLIELPLILLKRRSFPGRVDYSRYRRSNFIYLIIHGLIDVVVNHLMSLGTA